MREKKHERDENGVCWIVQTVKGEIAWILCGRASYEAVIRCDEHSPLAIHPPDCERRGDEGREAGGME